MPNLPQVHLRMQGRVMTDVACPICEGRVRPALDTATGEIVERCFSCGALADLVEPPAPLAPDVPDGSPWRCRDHHEPVTWRRNGCRACDNERRERNKTTPDHLKARRR
jgi:hypothetical protein